jgi:hypothetical protein
LEKQKKRVRKSEPIQTEMRMRKPRRQRFSVRFTRKAEEVKPTERRIAEIQVPKIQFGCSVRFGIGQVGL